MATATAPTPVPAKQIIYCGVCSLPPEYCEFGGTLKRCSDWLQTTHPTLHSTLYSAATLSANLSALSVDAQKRAEKDSKKKTARAEAAEAKAAELKDTSVVKIKRIARQKNKYVTCVQGLEAHGLELKKVAKEFGKRFATGSSVTKVPAGGEEITVQGDVSDDVYDYLVEHYPDIPEDNLELIEEKKKKGAAAS